MWNHTEQSEEHVGRGLGKGGYLRIKRRARALVLPRRTPQKLGPQEGQTHLCLGNDPPSGGRLETNGATGAAAFMRQIGSGVNVARELAYRLYSICDAKKRYPTMPW